MKHNELIQLLETFAPERYACSWDNPGLVAGNYDRDIKKVVVALDATNEVIDQAVKSGADMIITHHPMVFSAIKKINNGDFLGAKIVTLLENHISCFAMHTNYDVAQMADLAGEMLDFPEDADPLEVTAEEDGKLYGIGKVMVLDQEVTLGEYAAFVKKSLGLDHVMVFGDANQKVKKTAVSPGSGRSMTTIAAEQNVDVIVTGDIGHHEGLDALDMGLSVIEAGHYGTEYIFVDHVSEFLKEHTSLEILPVKTGVPYKVV